jgi:hypothetical protein
VLREVRAEFVIVRFHDGNDFRRNLGRPSALLATPIRFTYSSRFRVGTVTALQASCGYEHETEIVSAPLAVRGCASTFQSHRPRASAAVFTHVRRRGQARVACLGAPDSAHPD